MSSSRALPEGAESWSFPSARYWWGHMWSAGSSTGLLTSASDTRMIKGLEYTQIRKGWGQWWFFSALYVLRGLFQFPPMLLVCSWLLLSSCLSLPKLFPLLQNVPCQSSFEPTSYPLPHLPDCQSVFVPALSSGEFCGVQSTTGSLNLYPPIMFPY